MLEFGKWSTLHRWRESLRFDLRINEICVKFRLTGRFSGFSAPHGQNEFSRNLAKERVIWENWQQHVSLLIKGYRWAKNERNSNFELVPQKVDFGRYFRLKRANLTRMVNLTSNLPRGCEYLNEMAKKSPHEKRRFWQRWRKFAKELAKMKEIRSRLAKFQCDGEEAPWKVAILTKMLYMAKFKILNMVKFVKGLHEEHSNKLSKGAPCRQIWWIWLQYI